MAIFRNGKVRILLLESQTTSISSVISLAIQLMRQLSHCSLMVYMYTASFKWK